MQTNPLPLILSAALALVIGFAIAWLLFADPAGAAAGGPGGSGDAPVAPVDLQTVERRSLPLVFETLGSLRAPRRVELSVPESGLVTAVHFQDGQNVEAGDLLLELDSEREAAAVAITRSGLDEAQRQLRVAQRLTSGETIAQDEIERLQAAVRSAEAQLRQAEANRQRRQLRAPFDGTLGLRRVEPGASIGPGTLVSTLVQLDPLRLSAALPERFLPYLDQETRLMARLPDGEEVAGRLAYVAAEVDPASRSLPVEAEFPNPQRRMRPGQSLQVRVVLSGQEDVLVLPEEAVVYEGNRSYVYVVVPGQEEGTRVALPRDVELGARADGLVVAESGLDVGEAVVVRGLQKIFFPGMQVRTGPPAEAGGRDAAAGPDGDAAEPAGNAETAASDEQEPGSGPAAAADRQEQE